MSTADPHGSSIWHVDRTERVRELVSGDPGMERALVLVRENGRNCGAVTIEGTGAPESDPAVAAVPAAPRRGWNEGAGATVPATVVICTTGRSDLLAASVKAVLAQDHRDYRVVVVDNAPTTGLARTALKGIDDERLTVVNASRPGLSRARNRGVLAATGEVVAFTDDDAIVDPHWLAALIDPFTASPLVGATTGIVLPLELVHAPQRWFESRGGFPKDFTPRVWAKGKVPDSVRGLGEAGDGGPLYPVATARVGAGVCMALRRDVLMEVGPFDPSLGAGTPTRGGEDLDMFARVLAHGDVIVHTPDALVHHRHRVDHEGLDAQVRGNGSGMSALLVKAVLARPSTALTLASRAPAVAARLRPGSARVAGTDDDVPSGLTRSEVKGFLEGPVRYLRSRHANRLRPRKRPSSGRADGAEGAPKGPADGRD